MIYKNKNFLLLNEREKKRILNEQKEIKKKGLRALIKWLQEKDRELYKVPIYLPYEAPIPQYL